MKAKKNNKKKERTCALKNGVRVELVIRWNTLLMGQRKKFSR